MSTCHNCKYLPGLGDAVGTIQLCDAHDHAKRILFEQITAAELLRGDIVLVDHRGITAPIHYIDIKTDDDVCVRLGQGAFHYEPDAIVLRRLSRSTYQKNN